MVRVPYDRVLNFFLILLGFYGCGDEVRRWNQEQENTARVSASKQIRLLSPQGPPEDDSRMIVQFASSPLGNRNYFVSQGLHEAVFRTFWEMREVFISFRQFHKICAIEAQRQFAPDCKQGSIAFENDVAVLGLNPSTFYKLIYSRCSQMHEPLIETFKYLSGWKSKEVVKDGIGLQKRYFFYLRLVGWLYRRLIDSSILAVPLKSTVSTLLELVEDQRMGVEEALNYVLTLGGDRRTLQDLVVQTENEEIERDQILSSLPAQLDASCAEECLDQVVNQLFINSPRSLRRWGGNQVNSFLSSLPKACRTWREVLFERRKWALVSENKDILEPMFNDFLERFKFVLIDHLSVFEMLEHFNMVSSLYSISKRSNSLRRNRGRLSVGIAWLVDDSK